MPQQQSLAISKLVIPSITPCLTFSGPLHTERILDGRFTDARVGAAVGRRDIFLEPLVLRACGFDGIHELEVEIGKLRVERVDWLPVRIAGRLVRDDGLGDFCSIPSAFSGILYLGKHTHVAECVDQFQFL